MNKNAKATHPIDCSIIIPNLHSPIIDRTIKAILAQDTKYTYEIIVVGMDKYGLVEKIPEVRFIKTKTVTLPGTSRNIGAFNALGEFLLFIDADCIPMPQWLEIHLQSHHDASRSLVVGGGVTFPSSNYLTLCDNISSFHEYMIHLHPKKMKSLPSINLSLPKVIWQELGGFNNNQSSEDIDFTFRAWKNNINLCFNPATVVEHHPYRNTIKEIVEHSFIYGTNSIRTNPNYWNDLKIPIPIRLWWVAPIISPLISIYNIIKIICLERLPLKYWHTLPTIFILKIAWVIGFANTLRKNNQRPFSFLLLI